MGDGAPQIASGTRAYRRFEWLLIPVLVSGVLLVVYSPALLYTYDYHDSFYRYRLDDATCHTRPQWLTMFVVGRPIYNIANCLLTQSLISTPADTYKVRLVAIALLCISAAYTARVATRRGVAAPFAALLAAALFVLPAYQVMVNMTSDAANLFMLPLMVLAFHLLDHKAADAPLWAVGVRFGGIVVVLLATLLINQQLAPFFFVLIAIVVLLSPDRREIRRLLVTGTVLFGAAGVLYLTVHSFVLVPYVEALKGHSLDAEGFHQVVVDMSIKPTPGRALTFVFDNSERVFSLWFINIYDYLWVVVIGLAVTAAVFFIGNGAGQDRELASPAERALWLIVLFGLVNVLVLMSSEDDAPQRHIAPYEGLIVCLIALMCYRQRVLRGALYVFLVAALSYTAWNVKRNLAEPNAAELAYLSQQLKATPTSALNRLCVVGSPYANLAGYRSHRVRLKAEFGRTTTMFRSDVPSIVLAAAKYVGIPLELVDNSEIIAPRDANPEDCTAIIDMRQFQEDFRRKYNLEFQEQ